MRNLDNQEKVLKTVLAGMKKKLDFSYEFKMESEEETKLSLFFKNSSKIQFNLVENKFGEIEIQKENEDLFYVDKNITKETLLFYTFKEFYFNIFQPLIFNIMLKIKNENMIIVNKHNELVEYISKQSITPTNGSWFNNLIINTPRQFGKSTISMAIAIYLNIHGYNVYVYANRGYREILNEIDLHLFNNYHILTNIQINKIKPYIDEKIKKHERICFIFDEAAFLKRDDEIKTMIEDYPEVNLILLSTPRKKSYFNSLCKMYKHGYLNRFNCYNLENNHLYTEEKLNEFTKMGFSQENIEEEFLCKIL